MFLYGGLEIDTNRYLSCRSIRLLEVSVGATRSLPRGPRLLGDLIVIPDLSTPPISI
jgi:hypothetical protein